MPAGPPRSGVSAPTFPIVGKCHAWIRDINAFGLSGNGKQIWFAQDVAINKNTKEKDIYPDLPKNSARIYDDLNARHWDTWDDGSRSHNLYCFAQRYDPGTRSRYHGRRAR